LGSKAPGDRRAAGRLILVSDFNDPHLRSRWSDTRVLPTKSLKAFLLDLPSRQNQAQPMSNRSRPNLAAQGREMTVGEVTIKERIGRGVLALALRRDVLLEGLVRKSLNRVKVR